MRRLALLACLSLLAFPAAVRAADGVGGSVTGLAYQDANADGAGPQDGEAGLAGWIVWADLDGNAVRDAAEPSATAGADGRYSLGPLSAGDYTLRIEPPDASACPQGATCARPVAIADGVQSSLDFPVTAATDPGRQLLDEDPVRVGEVALAVPRSCARRPFVATLAGNGVTRVDFRVDGRLIRSVRAPDKAGRFAAHVDPRRLRRGSHTLTAAVWFSRLAAQPGRHLSAVFHTCAGGDRAH